MTINDHPETFANRAIVEFDTATGIADSKSAYRLSVSYDDPPDAFRTRFDRLAADPKAASLEAIVIGMWASDPGESADTVVRLLVDNKSRFESLRALFFGDIVAEESEISWIEQTDVTPLLDAFPRLEVLRVRGGKGLVLHRVSHASLRELVIETGGMPSEVVSTVANCSFPALEHLELWLGTDEYGGTTKLTHLDVLFRKDPFPALRYLGLRNSAIVGTIVFGLQGAPILKHVRVLDLSMGTLTDEEAVGLLRIPELVTMERVDVSENFLTAPVIRLLEAGKLPVVAEEQKEADEDEGEMYRYVSVSE